jgi:hypothetical protein
MKKTIIIAFTVLLIIMVSLVYADLTGTEGLAIDLSSAGAGTDFTIAFDPTELLGNRTWGDASTDTIVWTWDRNTGTDLTMTVGDAIVSYNGTVTAGVGFDVTGAADMDYGSIDVLDHTFTNDDCVIIFDAGITVSTGDTITLGAVVWNSSDNIDGEVIADNTIDDDSIDFADVTGVDITLTDCGAITSTGIITATTSFIGPLFDAAGAEDMDYGSIDVTDHTFATDGTGTLEIVLPAGSIDGTEILDDTIDSADYAAASIDNEHINWADISNLGDNGAATLAATVTVADDEATDDDQEVVFTTDNVTLESDGDFHYSPDTGTVTATIFSTSANIKSEPKHMIFNIIDPLATQTEDNEICLWPAVPAALTVTKIQVTLDAAANEVAGDLKWADAFIGLAGATVINVFDTTSGVLVDATITAGAVASGKCIYIAFDSAPNTAIKQMCVDITFDYD